MPCRVRNWIPPDFAQQGYISEARGSRALRFTFQPARVLERAELRAADVENPAHGLVQRVANVLSDKLFAWDLRDDAGEILPVTAANILRMQPELFESFTGSYSAWCRPTSIRPGRSRCARKCWRIANWLKRAASRSAKCARARLKKLLPGVKLLVLHPQIVRQSCDECRRWIFTDAHRKLLRGGQPVEHRPTCPRRAELPQGRLR